MKGKSIVTWLVLALAVSALLLASCGKAKTSTGSPESTTSKPPAGSATTTAGSAATKTTAAATTTKPPTGSSGSSIASLLGKFAANSSVKYDSVTTGPGNPSTTQAIWLKGTKMRIEMTVQGAKSVILIDQGARVMYNYMPDQNTAFKMDISQAPGSVSTDTTKIQDYNPVIIGTETIDGKLCTIIQFTNQAVTTKEWLWQDRGFPDQDRIDLGRGRDDHREQEHQFRGHSGQHVRTTGRRPDIRVQPAHRFADRPAHEPADRSAQSAQVTPGGTHGGQHRFRARQGEGPYGPSPFVVRT